MRTILRQAIANSQCRESYLMERRIHGQIQEAEDQEGEIDKAEDTEDKTDKATSSQKG